MICATPWKWHTPVCLAANASDKHAVSEVPIVLTVEEAWQLVESYEKTKRWSTLGLENTGVSGTAIGERGGKPCLKVYVSNSKAGRSIPKKIGGFKVVVEKTGAFRRL